MASTTNFGYNIGDVLKEYLDDPIFILNEDYDFEYVSEKFLSKNLSLNALEGKMSVILHPNDSQRCVDFLHKVLTFEQAVETLRVRYGDTYRFYEFKGRLFKNEIHETKYLLTSRDITQFKKKEDDWNKKEKKLEKSAETMQEIRFWKLLQTKEEKNSFQKSQEILKQSEEKYRHLFESSPYAIWIVDLNGVLVDCNPTTNIMFSKDTREDLVGKHFVEVLGMLERPEYFIPFFKSKFENFVQDKRMQALEFKMTRADGIKKWIHITGSKIKLGDDTFIQAIIQDITEKKLAELKLQRSEEELKILNKELEKKVRERTEELRESEEHFRTIAEHSTIGITILQDEKMIYANEALSRINGFTIKEMRSWTSKELVNHVLLEDREHAIHRLKGRLAGASDIPDTNSYRITTKDGTIKWIESFSKTITYKGKIADLALIMDITEQKRAEQLLKESEEKFRTIAESSLMGIAIIQDNRIKYVNQLSTNLTGYTVDETKELNPAKVFEFIHPDDRNWVVEQLKKKQSGSIDYITNYQYRIINKSGEIKWLDNFSKSIEYMGKPADLVTVLDITDRKKAEQELKESEEKFRTITEHSTIGIIIIQDEKVMYVNKAMSDINEYPKNEMMEWSPEELINIVHPEDRKKAIKYLKGRQSGDSSLPPYNSYRILTKNEKVKWVDSYSKAIKYIGQIAVLALISDVTDQNLAKQELKESEEKYRTLFENMNTGFAYHEVLLNDDNKPIDYRYLEANSQFEKLTGLKVSDIIGKTVTEILPGIENDPADWIGRYGNVALTGEPLTAENYSEQLDRWYKVSGYSPKKGFFAVSFSDITDRKRAEKKLKESEEKYRHLFENAPFSIVLLNFEGKIIEMNRATTILFGYQEKDLIDKKYLTLTDLFPKETIPGLRLVQDLMSKGVPSDPIMKPQITKIYNKDKKPMWVASELSTVSISGEILILAIIQDITEKKIAEEKLKESERILRQQNIELKELDRLKTDFISIAAHDLKTPLISVGGYVDLILLREKGLKEEVKEDLNRVLSNVHRLDGYINRLLDVMKIEAKKVELVKREEKIHDIIIDCLFDLEFQVSQKNLTVNVNVSENLELSVDNFRISQALLNLLSNAVKFTPKNGKIDISIIEDDEKVLFNIKDNGKGLTPEEIQKLFGKFVTIEQGVDGYSTFDKGSGLGLYIARGFIEAHGGKIWVESKGRDLGAEFSFTLPKK
ncbi:MAG: PAS domain-containing sensor histidine kinase [Promethearchaeota archaeon]